MAKKAKDGQLATEGSIAKGIEKLAATVDGIVELVAGPDRVVKRAQARGEALVIQATAEATANEIAARTADRLRNREYRRQENIEAITAEAQKALPPPTEPISDAPVSEDFVYRFFEEAQDIGDKEMQRLWGMVLAGEVAKPGSFQPRTLRVLKDMTKKDAEGFVNICRFGWWIGNFTIVVLNHDDEIYGNNGISFDLLKNLDAFGIISFDPIGGFRTHKLPPKFTVAYAGRRVTVELPAGRDDLSVGKVILTSVGRDLAQLGDAQHVDGFVDYVAAKWRASGATVTVSDPAE